MSISNNQKKLKNAKLIMIPSAKHELFNEKQELKKRVFDASKLHLEVVY